MSARRSTRGCRRGWTIATALAVAGVLTAGCGPSKVTLPTPPMAEETQQLAATYQAPTAVLDTSNIQQTFADAKARLNQLQLDWLPTVVVDALAKLRQKLRDNGLPDTAPDAGGIADAGIDAGPASTSGRQVTAVAEVQRICAGWDAPAGPIDAAANGEINLTGIIDTGHLQREIWAVATDCLTRIPPADVNVSAVDQAPAINATINGTLIFYLFGPLPDTINEAQMLVIFDGTIGVGGQTAAASFDFELIGKTVKFRVPAGGGDAIVTVGTTLGIEAANAGFSCELSTGSCQQNH